MGPGPCVFGDTVRCPAARGWPGAESSIYGPCVRGPGPGCGLAASLKGRLPSCSPGGGGGEVLFLTRSCVALGGLRPSVGRGTVPCARASAQGSSRHSSRLPSKQVRHSGQDEASAPQPRLRSNIRHLGCICQQPGTQSGPHGEVPGVSRRGCPQQIPQRAALLTGH